MGRPRKNNNDKTENIKLTIPKTLKEKGKKEGINFSELLTKALYDYFNSEKKH